MIVEGGIKTWALILRAAASFLIGSKHGRSRGILRDRFDDPFFSLILGFLCLLHFLDRSLADLLPALDNPSMHKR